MERVEDPTPEQLEERREAIKASWSERERHKREAIYKPHSGRRYKSWYNPHVIWRSDG